MQKIWIIFLGFLMLSGCNTLDRVKRQLGEPLEFTPIDEPPPVGKEGKRVLQMPMPPIAETHRETNSLWSRNGKTFLQDQRASQVGDIVNVDIKINDQADIQASTNRQKTNNSNLGVGRLLGLERNFAYLKQTGGDETNNLMNMGNSSNNLSDGKISRKETINLKVAALVIQVLPNGNLVLAGRQEVRVNQEIRQLQVAGIIRPADISSNNTVDYKNIAEARIAYGGKGTISDLQEVPYGQALMEAIWPF